jgi:hypothetical protein
MTGLPSNRLVQVWAFAVLVTIASWRVAADGDHAFRVNAAVTAAVLLIAATKVWLVLRYFMEVRSGPTWLRWTCYSWLTLAFAMTGIFSWWSL